MAAGRETRRLQEETKSGTGRTYSVQVSLYGESQRFPSLTPGVNLPSLKTETARSKRRLFEEEKQSLQTFPSSLFSDINDCFRFPSLFPLSPPPSNPPKIILSSIKAYIISGIVLRGFQPPGGV